MRLSISKSKNATSLYVIKDVIKNNKRTTKVVEKLGTLDELQDRLYGQDPIEWAKAYIAELNRKERENNRDVIVKYSQSKLIERCKQRSFNGGYLFLQRIYHGLGLHTICETISSKYKFTFNLDSILSRLLYSRIIYPASKLATYQLSKRFVEQPDFELQHVYRALSILAKESDFIQSELYSNSLMVSKRNTSVLYYDCTNYFFEIEHEDGLRQYGFSKDHKPNPIVQMGLFMDGDGIPLAFCIDKGNTNEQLTLTPLEKQILSDFKLSRFVVCTDAGLSSIGNRRFNDKGDRAFITTQSVKKLKKHIKEWALDTKGWLLDNSGNTYDISDIDEEKYKDRVFYKERWINEDGLEQRLIVTYSIKYRDYQRQIRSEQINRAINAVDNTPSKLKYINQNDYKRFILKTHYTPDGEVAQKEALCINVEMIAKEEAFDGFYAVCTNLEDDASAIIRINKKRWEIEECFRIMKSEFKVRPVNLSRDDRIQAHFMTCFIALIIYRLLEKRLGDKYTCHEILSNLREMNFYYVPTEGYIPTYIRNDFTDDLHEAFGFRTDYQIVSDGKMKQIIKSTKR